MAGLDARCSHPGHRRILITIALVLVSTHSRNLAKGAEVTATYQQMSCTTNGATAPRSTEEVSSLVASLYVAARKSGSALKIRATHNKFHSTAPFPCPNGYTSKFPDEPEALEASETKSLMIMTDNMDKVLDYDPEANTMRVQAGMTVGELLDAASARKMVVPLGSVPAFNGLTLGGILSTGAHGTGSQASSTLADFLLEVAWVDGTGKIHLSARDSEEGRAICGGLGLVGVATELKLQLEPPSNTRVEGRRAVSDANIAQDILTMVKATPHTIVVWRPDLEKYSSHQLTSVAPNTPITGKAAASELPPQAAQLVGAMLEGWEKDLGSKLLPLELAMAGVAVQTSLGHAWASDLNGKPLFSATGKANEMAAVGCGSGKCFWEDSKIAMDDIHFTIELEQLPAWIADVKKIVKEDFWMGSLRKGKVLPPGYFWLRFGQGNRDYLSQNSGLKSPAHVQLSAMKSIANTEVPGKYAWIFEAIEQLTLCKYGGRPHWGKNTVRSYLHPKCPVKAMLPGFSAMQVAQAKNDPLKVFEPPLFSKLAKGESYTLGPKCVVGGNCYCEEDSHCATAFKCGPSKAFPEYNVCKPFLEDLPFLDLP